MMSNDAERRWRSAIRRSAKWGATVTAAILTAVWIASVWWYAQWVGSGGYAFGSGRGSFWAVDLRGVSTAGTSLGFGLFGPGGQASLPASIEMTWWFRRYTHTLHVPIWFPALIAWCIAAAGWYFHALARRRESTGLCLACGYDLAGLPPGSPCPECGTK